MRHERRCISCVCVYGHSYVHPLSKASVVWHSPIIACGWDILTPNEKNVQHPSLLRTNNSYKSVGYKGIPTRSTDQLLQDTLTNLQKNANSLYIAACKWDKWNPPKGEEAHHRSLQAFKEIWVESGLTKITPVKSQPVILRAHGH